MPGPGGPGERPDRVLADKATLGWESPAERLATGAPRRLSRAAAYLAIFAPCVVATAKMASASARPTRDASLR